jgi:hypothetical protein
MQLDYDFQTTSCVYKGQETGRDFTRLNSVQRTLKERRMWRSLHRAVELECSRLRSESLEPNYCGFLHIITTCPSSFIVHSSTGAYSPGWTFGLPFGGFLITHIQTHGRTPLDEWSALRRDLYLHRRTQQTNIYAPSGIRTRDPSDQTAADLSLRPRGHWDRLSSFIGGNNYEFLGVM